MAKELFWAAALLLGCLAHSGLACNVSIERIDLPDHGKVQLKCIVTENATSLTWTLDGNRLPVAPQQPTVLIVEVPAKYADGKANFGCSATCGDRSGYESTRLEIPDTNQDEVSATAALNVVMGVALLVMIVLHVACNYGHYFRRCCRHCKTTSESTGGQDIPMTARPLAADEVV